MCPEPDTTAGEHRWTTRETATLIDARFADLSPVRVEFMGEGWEFMAFRVNDAYVFRLPKWTQCDASLRREFALLPEIAQRTDLAIPNYEYVGETEDGLAFGGYREIVGDPLTPETYAVMAPDGRDLVADTLAEFMRAIHSIPVALAEDGGVPHEPFGAAYEETRDDARQYVLPQLSPEDRAICERMFDEYLDDPANEAYVPTFLHSDLVSEHVLWDRRTERVAGIIDFGDMIVGDPDFEFTYLVRHGDLARRILARYPTDDPERTLRKAWFFYLTGGIYGVAEGERLGHRHKVVDGWEEIRSTMPHLRAYSLPGSPRH